MAYFRLRKHWALVTKVQDRGSCNESNPLGRVDGLGAVHYKSVLRWCATRPFGSAKVLVNDHATVNLNDGAPNDDPPKLILVIVVGTSLIRVGLAAVLLGLAGR